MHEIFLQSYHMKWVCRAPQKETLKLISLTSCDINQISILFNKEKTKVCLEILQLSQFTISFEFWKIITDVFWQQSKGTQGIGAFYNFLINTDFQKWCFAPWGPMSIWVKVTFTPMKQYSKTHFVSQKGVNIKTIHLSVIYFQTTDSLIFSGYFPLFSFYFLAWINFQSIWELLF